MVNVNVNVNINVNAKWIANSGKLFRLINTNSGIGLEYDSD